MKPEDLIFKNPEGVVDVGLEDPELPFDPYAPEPQHPEWVWVRIHAPLETVVWRRFSAESAPKDGLQFLPDLGSEPGPTEAQAPAPELPSRKKMSSGDHKPKINLIRLDTSEDEAHVDQKSGLLPKPVYLRLAKLGRFPSFKVGQSHLAKRADVLAYLAKEAAAVTNGKLPKVVEEDVGADELRRMMGLRPRKGS